MTDVDLSDIPELMSIKEAAAAVHLSSLTIRNAIRSGALAATIIAGRDPRKAGRGLGYRIHRDALQRWYFGQNTVPGGSS